MFLSHSFQGLAKYPQNILYGVAIKHTINTHLVGPVAASGDRVNAFRVIWRVAPDVLAHAWDTITSQRRLCDQIVAQSPSLQMFVSCISGVFSKNIGAGPETRPIYPAVSYWTVFEGTDAGGYGNLTTRRLFSACPSAEVKPIKSLRHSDESLSPDCGPLFVTLKDHAGSFVMQKINNSLLAMGAPGVSSHPPNARLVVTSRSKYLTDMPEIVSALQVAGLRINMDIS